MHFLNEELLLRGKPAEDFTEALDEKDYDTAFQIVIDTLKKEYPRQYALINNAILENNYLDILLTSIKEHGFDTSKNAFLDFALSNDNYLSIPREQASIINTCLTKKTLSEDVDWLYDPDAYTSVFKLKTLIYLQTPDARPRGKDLNKASKDILKLKNDEDIKEYLEQWVQENKSYTTSRTRDRLSIKQLQQMVNEDLESDGEIQESTLDLIWGSGCELIEHSGKKYVVYSGD